MVERIEAGTVWVNEYRTLSYRSPFGGYKDSDLGRENGREGLEEYQQTKKRLDRPGRRGRRPVHAGVSPSVSATGRFLPFEL
jgi:hypothetical protein